ncbi:MAG: hypothetical protein QN173_11105 [Armatimonadota bacterium]|nr:hypothetical protein [Armatimonadota bacterium]MDR7403688.1 hypothetical protein [Armatimonadota bacterium]MDR7471518.1 hypothetical protein [Armatimonadota bacterium]MDR7508141.1 hypothetical protein [Armatimonadota bacterium]MDR7509576.1 hypothetical protein [Armatimonadota bacterium]
MAQRILAGMPRDDGRLSGSEIRRLRELRERVTVAALTLPVPLQRRLLELLEQARPWTVPARPVPEMTRGELVRAIRWRLGTIPLPGAAAAAAFVDRHRRLASAGRRRARAGREGR